MKYSDFIEKAELVVDPDIVVTTGDLDYSGTAIEITKDEKELFHFVISATGEKEILFFGKDGDYRLPLSLMEKLIADAKKELKYSKELLRKLK